MHAVLAGAREGGDASDAAGAESMPPAASTRYELCFRSLLAGDADVSFPLDYFERLLADFVVEFWFGIVGGVCWEREDGTWKPTQVTGEHVGVGGVVGHLNSADSRQRTATT